MADGNVVSTGPGLIYAASIGTVEPIDSTTALPVAWRPIGFTNDGSVFNSATTWNGIFAEEALNAIRMEPNQTVETFAFAALESTKQNLAMALNKGAAVANDAVALSPSAAAAFQRVMLVHQSVAGARLLIRRCVQTGAIALTNKKSPDKKMIGMVFTLEDVSPLMPWTLLPASAPAALVGAI